jgi:hypothetical protein
MAPMRAVSMDPRGDALARLSELLGGNGQRTRAIVAALDPVILPLFLEVGCILMFDAAFPHRRAPVLQRSAPDAILIDQLPQRSGMNQREIARQWGVHPSTVSRRLRAMEAAGRVQRIKDGRCKLALPAPHVV